MPLLLLLNSLKTQMRLTNDASSDLCSYFYVLKENTGWQDSVVLISWGEKKKAEYLHRDSLALYLGSY